MQLDEAKRILKENHCLNENENKDDDYFYTMVAIGDVYRRWRDDKIDGKNAVKEIMHYIEE